MSITAPELDTGTPNGARSYDYLLGGKESFACDRDLVNRVSALFPPGAPGPRQLAERNRAFLERAVTASVHERIGQVLDLGAGFPAPKPLHEVARAARDAARVAYVDRDPVVVSHTRAAYAGIPGVACACADLGNPGSVMADADVRAVIDPSRPALAVLGLVLSLSSPGDARRIIEGWAEWLPSGSRFAITVPHTSDEVTWGRIAAACEPVPLHNHSARDVARMLEGLDLLGGGIQVARGWGPEAVESPGPGHVLAVVARKP